MRSSVQAAGTQPRQFASLFLLLCAAAISEVRQPIQGKAATHLQPISAEQAARAGKLYAGHCAACHGEKGDGNGVAVRFLEPRPRNLRDGRYRLISSQTAPVASAKDVLAVLERGMPGSSMPSWRHLPPMDRMLLVGQVLQFRQEGFSDKAKAMLTEEGEDATPASIAQYAAKLDVKAGPPLVAPNMPASSLEAIERGRLAFSKACAACHGPGGKGDGAQQMLTTEGFLQRPRDLTRGIFKGQHDAASLFRRIRLGLPGSAMPSNAQNTDAEIGDMIQFILSLSDEPTRQSYLTARGKIVAQRVSATFEKPDDHGWGAIAVSPITIFPLWWRDFDNPRLTVAAIHDGKKLAVRLAFKDKTCNDDMRRTDAFEDMAAVQWHLGPNEPFMGMGDAASPVNVWLWRAGWRQAANRDGVRHLDEYPFDGANYEQLFKERAGFPNPFAARAAGNLHADKGRSFSATAIAGRGLGTTTLRPRVAQNVAAHAVRTAEGWLVQFVQPLTAIGDAGASFKAGDQVSAAFAIWDGAAKDRNGQKLVSIWNDFVLQP